MRSKRKNENVNTNTMDCLRKCFYADVGFLFIESEAKAVVRITIQEQYLNECSKSVSLSKLEFIRRYINDNTGLECRAYWETVDELTFLIIEITYDNIYSADALSKIEAQVEKDTKEMLTLVDKLCQDYDRIIEKGEDINRKLNKIIDSSL